MKRLASWKGEPKFTVEEDLLAGIELSAKGQKISWTIDDYLLSLRESVEDLMKAGKKAPPSGSDSAPLERPQKSTPLAEEGKEKQ
ncbi:hypothetical protein MASR2M79_24010 [Aminivibrio sp.]